jgi:hypothetical protein
LRDANREHNTVIQRRHNQRLIGRMNASKLFLGLDGRGMPGERKSRLLARRPNGIFVAPFEQGEIGLELFKTECRTGLEGLVSKRRDRP